MKRVFALVALLSLAATSTFASRLNIRTSDSRINVIIVNGTEYPFYGNNISLDIPHSGRQIIEFASMRQGHRGKLYKDVLYRSELFVPGNMMIFTEMNAWGRLKVVDEFPLSNNKRGVRGYYGNKGKAYNQYYNRNTIVRRPAHGYTAMSNTAVRDLIVELQSLRFESTKKEMVLNVLRRNYISSDQLYGLLLEFSFESDRLEIAKAAYSSVVDKRNIRSIYKAFRFDSSVRQYEKYILRF